MKERHTEWIRTILSAACAIVVVTGAILIGLFLLPEFPALWITLCAICLAALIACAAVNFVCVRKIKDRFDKKTARQMYDYGLSVQKTVEEDYKAAERSALRTIAQGNAWVLSLMLLIALLFLFLGATRASWAALAGLFGVYVLTGLFENILVTSEKTPSHLFLGEGEFPLIFAAVRSAAEAAGCSQKLRLSLETDGIGVREEGGNICIGINAVECALLTREELYAVMLHEFAHVVNVDTARGRAFYRARRRWAEGGDSFFSGVASLFLSGAAMRIVLAAEIYQAFAARHHEMLADAKVRELGSCRAFIDATAKGTEFYLYNEMPQREMSYDCYASEEPPRDIVTRDLANFLAYREKYGQMWRQIMRQELPARVSTHPTLRQRMEAMGIDEYDDAKEEQDENYRAEQKKLVQFADEKVFESIRAGYAALREDLYLSRKAQMEKYHAAAAEGKRLPLDEQVLCLQAFYGIEDDTALQIADELLAQDEDAAFAHFYRAKIWFDRMDERCVEEFRKAMRVNYELCDSCLDSIGLFALRSGNEALLQEYRSNAPELSQDAQDRSDASRWKKGIPLRPCALPEESLAEIRARLEELSEGSVLRAYAADFGTPACTVIAVEMKRRAPGGEQSRVMESLYSYLCSRSENFALYYDTGNIRRAIAMASIPPFYAEKE